MGLSFVGAAGPKLKRKTENIIPHELGCKSCPLATQPGDMPATGNLNPLIYALGEAPGRTEVEDWKQFVGESGQLLRGYVPERFASQIRWNNVVRSHPPRNRTPERIEIEHCRPSVVKDIEETKPKYIFGFGNVPLDWVCGMNGITLWRGRRMPVQIGSHVCWYYAFMHPAALLRKRKWSGDESEDERMFVFDLERAFYEIEQGLPKPVVHTPEQAKSGVECITDIKQIEKALEWAAQQPEVGVDYETNCLRPYERDAKILTVAVGTSERAFAFPYAHPGFELPAEQSVFAVHDLWKQFLLTAPCRKIVHYLTFEMEWSAYFFGSETLRAGQWEDTASAAAIVDERRGKAKPGCFSLEFLVQQYFGFNVKKLSDVDRLALEKTSLHVVLNYNGIDAKYHAGLWKKLWAIIKQEGMEEAYELALRRVPTVVLSQLRGVPVDQDRVRVLQKKYQNLVTTVENDIADLRVIKEYEYQQKKKFNPYSNPNVIYVLDKMLKRKEVIVYDKYTKEEKRSAKEEVLTQIKHPLAKHLISLRSASGTKSKYIDPLLTEDEDTVIFPDGLIHPQYNTNWAETSRLSCSFPNLQNFPYRDPATKEVRSSIVAPPGCVILKFDYRQIEARVIAMFTKDKRFCNALWDRYDVHQDWAERIANDYPERIGGEDKLTDKTAMKTFRTDIKNQWTFPLFFGAQLDSVAGYLNIPASVLRPHYRAFWQEFKGIAEWQGRQLKFYQQYGYVESLTGRRRHGPLSINQVYNSPVQATAAEIVLDAMSRLSETEDPELQPEINIHDDLTYLRVPEERADVIAEKVIDIMLAVPFDWVNVPISVEMSCGINWAELEEVGVYSSDTWGK
jgi:uracil-DNA glycosylase family 4